MSEDAEVASVSGDVPVRTMSTVTAEAIGADQVWTGGFQGLRGFTGRGIGVAVIDTGVDAKHPYLGNRVALSLDFTGNRVERSRGRDENGHGTHVAGIIRDVAPGAHIVSLKAMGADGSGFTSNVIEALAVGDRQQAGVEPQDRQHLARARRDGVGEQRSAVPGRAAGDRRRPPGDRRGRERRQAPGWPGGRPRDHSPGNSRHALTVGAVNTMQTAARSDDVMATYSSRGPTMFDGMLKPELVAPGNRILSSVPRDGYLPGLLPERVTGRGANTFMELSGTSMSAAVAAGAAALLLEARSLTPREAKVVLQLTSSAVAGSGLARSRRREPERGRGRGGREATSRYSN